MTSLASYLLLGTAVFAGAFVSGMAGFAFSAVAGAILLHVFQPAEALEADAHFLAERYASDEEYWEWWRFSMRSRFGGTEYDASSFQLRLPVSAEARETLRQR